MIIGFLLLRHCLPTVFEPRITKYNALQNSTKHRQHGATLLEFSIVVFGILIGTLIYVDIANALNQYLKLTNIVHETVKYGATYAALSDGQFDSESFVLSEVQLSQCERGTGSTVLLNCGHALMHQRSTELISALDVKTFGSIIESRKFVSNLGGDEEDTVRVSVSAKVNSFILPDIPLRVQQQGPYLY